MSTANLNIHKVFSTKSQASALRAVRDHGPISRSRVAQQTGMTLQAVSRTVSTLLENNILTETPLADTTGIRRKPGLSLSSNIGHCFAISYDSSGLEGCVLDSAYNILTKISQKTDLQDLSKEEIIQKILSFTEELSAKKLKANGDCFGLSVVDPGIIDTETRIAICCSTLPQWENVRIADILEEKFHLPVMLLSGSIAHIRAVDRLEQQESVANLLYIKYGNGIGCSIKLQNLYISGKSNLAGEFGHLHVSNEAIPCRCGLNGCLEATTAFPALVRNVTYALKEGSNSFLANAKEINGRAILKAAAENDRLATRVVFEAFTLLGRTVGGLINILSPETVLFDNSIKTAGPDAFHALTQTVRQNVIPAHLNNLDLRISEIESHISCLGGAVALIDYCLCE